MLAQQYGRTDDPLIRQELATIHTRERALSFMSARIMAAVRKRETPPVDPSILKLFATGTRIRSGNLAMEIAGAGGIVGDDERSLWIQNELVGRYGISIGGGTSEVQRNNLAERALGLPREPGYAKDTPWKDIPRS